MVSLQPNRFSANRVRGAQYMDEVINDGNMATSSATNSLAGDREPILATSRDDSFKKLKTIPIFSIHLAISSTISLVSIILTVQLPEEKHNEAYFVMASLRAAFWLITFLFDYLIRKHHNGLRMNGYHEFHRRMALHNGVALNLVSGWNTVLLLIQSIIHYYSQVNLWNSWFTPNSCFAAFNIIETTILTIVHGLYMSSVSNFNKLAQPPDALRGDSSSPGSLGLIQPGANLAELLEKQADLIAYLQDHNQKLNQKLHQMQLSARPTHFGP
uniref:Transmembrane protein 192 n=1 Tax=Glossina palpalis gambiensis TaxID=67801 RepID=A0A1B0BF62_9MUSC